MIVCNLWIQTTTHHPETNKTNMLNYSLFLNVYQMKRALNYLDQNTNTPYTWKHSGKKTNMIEKHVKEKKPIIEKHCMLWLIYTYKFTYLCSNIEDLPKTNRQSNWELILTYRIDWNIFLWIHCWYWMYGECNEYWYTEYGYN